jgi:NACHT-associated inactive restriction endonuclease
MQGAHALAARDKYQFQWWACSLLNAQPYKKKGADGGVDGLIFFQDDRDMAKKIVVSAKGGEHVNVAMIRDLKGVIERDRAAIGVFLTLARPSQPMRKEAAAAGFYSSPAFNRALSQATDPHGGGRAERHGAGPLSRREWRPVDLQKGGSGGASTHTADALARQLAPPESHPLRRPSSPYPLPEGEGISRRRSPERRGNLAETIYSCRR